jgi:hypothetical protein
VLRRRVAVARRAREQAPLDAELDERLVLEVCTRFGRERL